MTSNIRMLTSESNESMLHILDAIKQVQSGIQNLTDILQGK